MLPTVEELEAALNWYRDAAPKSPPGVLCAAAEQIALPILRGDYPTLWDEEVGRCYLVPVPKDDLSATTDRGASVLPATADKEGS